MSTKNFFITIVLAISMVGCHPKSQLELYGTYVANYDIAKEKLILNADGSFIQEVTLKKTSKVDVARGAWYYNPKTGNIKFDNKFMIVLNGFREFDPNYAHPKQVTAVYPANKYFGEISLGSAEGILYRKIE